MPCRVFIDLLAQLSSPPDQTCKRICTRNLAPATPGYIPPLTGNSFQVENPEILWAGVLLKTTHPVRGHIGGGLSAPGLCACPCVRRCEPASMETFGASLALVAPGNDFLP